MNLDSANQSSESNGSVRTTKEELDKSKQVSR